MTLQFILAAVATCALLGFGIGLLVGLKPFDLLGVAGVGIFGSSLTLMLISMARGAGWLNFAEIIWLTGVLEFIGLVCFLLSGRESSRSMQ